MPHFTEDSLQRIIINLFYAITVAALLTEEHEPAVGEAELVRANATLLEAMGGEQWLRQLLDVLEGKVDAAEQPINPFQAVTIDPLFASPHPPLIEREPYHSVLIRTGWRQGRGAGMRNAREARRPPPTGLPGTASEIRRNAS